MARRRSRLIARHPLATTFVLLGAICVGVWIFSGPRTRLMSEVGISKPEKALQSDLPAEATADAAKVATAEPVPVAAATPTVGAKAGVSPPAPPTTQPGAQRPVLTQDPEQAARDLEAGLAAKARNDFLAAREQLNRALHSGLKPDQLATARQAMTDLSAESVFSPKVIPNDPLTESYTVQAGNSLARLAKRSKVPEELLAQINRITNPNFIRQGMRLKLVHGPFHASISKSEHMLHLYLQDVYVRSFRVALGSEGKTPTGLWKVVRRQANPDWVDPNTGKRWHQDDPANPIGEYWVGLEGIEGACVGAVGYGIHGTNEPETIGQDVSLGCVRLAPDDIEQVYRTLLPGESFVTIVD